MKRHMKENVYWVGKIDWELTKFHGDEYSTHRGSSYNSYLIEEEKVVLIDTVWAPFSSEFIENLSKEIDLSRIDYVIANHAEVDHSGALPELMRHIPDVPIYCTANGVKSLKGHYHQDWNFKTVKTGDTLDIGNGKQLVFIEAPMLHWPDSMFTYLTGDNILFSNDAFGQHYASEYLFNDLVDQNELYSEAIKYYANILTPFSTLVKKKINEVLSLEVPVDMIATSHGVIWRDDPTQIVKKYLEWADDYRENRIAIVYDTMWGGTRRLAETISKGIKEADPEVDVRLFNNAERDKNDVVTEIFRSKAVLFGSPTINKGILTSMAALIEEVKGLKFHGKKAAAFGPYGWSGESVSILTGALEESGFEIVSDGLKTLWEPDEQILEEARQYGAEFAKKMESL
ncbi:MAG: anaerobic nitric oxide reductase flavorubredoxin [Spirochaetales bacterium]|nr:anaerobic nitric oxide reductase flavorubredoxin [Spirochaetales bacterium]MCF7939291.1 anaerobic nitric oxide reductase flavorubredoxin [Spirochaetales bacterium]